MQAYMQDLPGGTRGKEPACQCRRHRDTDSIPGWEDPLEEGMENHSSIFAWKIPWIEESGGLYSMELQRVRHDLVTEKKQKQ